MLVHGSPFFVPLQSLRDSSPKGAPTLSVIAARCQIPPFVATRHLPPAGGSLSSQGELFGMAGRFLIAFETSATGLTACALSVTCGDSSPKGRAKGTAGSFLIMPNTLATNLTAWLPLRGSWRGSA